MDNLESAVTAALDPNLSDLIKSQATTYCERVRESPDGWQLCLGLFVKFPQTHVQVRFFCLQVLEDVLRFRLQTLAPENALMLRQTLWKWTCAHYQESDPIYLKNKLAVVLTMLFKYQYLQEWNSFFDDLFALVFGKNLTTRLVDLFLRICITLDEEIVCTTRGQKEAALLTAIKDTMRLNAVEKLTEAWISILLNYAGTQPEIAQVCIRLFGSYVSWIDINLVVQERFVSVLYQSLNSASLRIAALNLASVSPKPESEDLELDMVIAKLINATGVEICSGLDDSQLSADLIPLAFDLLNRIFPSLLQFMSKTDQDVCTVVFPFVGAFLLTLKRLKKTPAYASLTQIPERMNSLLRVLVLKMRHEPDYDVAQSLEPSEEECPFDHFRKELKTYMDPICALEPELFSNYIFSAVSGTFDAYTRPGHNLSWVDVELAIYLLFIFHESNKGGGAFSVTSPDGSIRLEKTPMGEMMSKLVSSNISAFPHLSIPLIYFETITRYAPFFDEYPEHIPAVLNSFVDKRGLHNPNIFIKNRVSYLFLRFVKSSKMKLMSFVGQILASIQDCFVITVSPSEIANRPTTGSSMGSKSDASTSSAFESQLFVFEAVGKLISYEPVPEKQREFLSAVVSPIVNQIEPILLRCVPGQDPESQMTDTVYLHHVIVAIGSIGKGFPDYDAENAIPPWTLVFAHAFKLIMAVLDRLSSRDIIREAVRYSLQRLVGCMGSEIMSDIVPALKTGLVSSGTSKELAEFLSFVGMVTFKFKTTFLPILNEMIIPLRERVAYFLSKETTGTDDMFELFELRRAYLTFLSNVFNADLEGALTSDLNVSSLSSTLQFVLSSLVDFSDVQSQKIACALIIKMVSCWGQDPETARPASPDDTKAPKKPNAASKPSRTETRKKVCLPGFDQFIYKSIVPVLFDIPYNTALNLADGQSVVFLSEIGSLHRIVYQAQGTKYLDYLARIAFPSLQISGEASQTFLNALSTMEARTFKKFLQEFTAATRKK